MAEVNFYPGADYGLEPDFEDEYSAGFAPDYSVYVGDFALTTDPRSANKIKEVSGKLNTGAKTIEIEGLSPDVLDSIPKQHFKELNRLKKITGADLTLHGPLVEPTGITQQGNWDPSLRQQAETKIWSAVERAHELEPEGNVIVTLHSSNGLPEPRSRIKTEDGKVVDSSLAVIDERTGRFGVLPRTGKDYLTGEEVSVDKELQRLNEENWSTNLSNVNISASRGRDVLESVGIDSVEPEKKNETLEIYKRYLKGRLRDEDLEKLGPVGKDIKEKINRLSYGDVFIRDSYSGFKNLFNQAYDAAEKSGNKRDLEKLKRLRKEIMPAVEEYQKDPSNVVKLAHTIEEGIRVLDRINPPQVFRPLEEFAVDKASETFSNVALKSYEKFGENSPIISIENPPAGMGLSRAEDLKKLIETTRKKFAEKLASKGVSKEKARQEAEKLIGATWDVGHINMIRGFGFGEKDVIKESEKIAPYVKHVHLSDNFGLEHTELPMGMGNVPLKKILKLSENFQKAKKIIETGNWYQHFKKSPFAETLRAFGSPVYAMKMAPYWDKAFATYGGYFSGYGRVLPEQHFNMYGAGFSNLPAELGGQMAGKSRIGGGTPME